MAEITLSAKPVLGGFSIDTGFARLTERSDLALVSVAIPLGQDKEVAKAFTTGLGIDLPDATRATGDDKLRAIRLTPDQIMVLFVDDAADPRPALAGRIGHVGYTTLQTDAWAVLELQCPDAAPILERLFPLDLSDHAFPVGAFARSVAEHMSAVVLRAGADRYLLMSASSSAQSFLHAVTTTLDYVADDF